MRPGEIYRHNDFYADSQSGELKSKYLLVLAIMRGGDIVYRLLTSRQHGRPESPPCFHGDPYRGFYLGIPGAPLDKKTWLDLGRQGDYDDASFASRLREGRITFVMQLPDRLLCDALECAAASDDTTTAQTRAIQDALAMLR